MYCRSAVVAEVVIEELETTQYACHIGTCHKSYGDFTSFATTVSAVLLGGVDALRHDDVHALGTFAIVRCVMCIITTITIIIRSNISNSINK